MLSLILPSILLLNAFSRPTLAQTVPSSNCTTDGVHMIVARGSTEQPGEGILGALAAQIMFQVPGSDAVAVDYPASILNYIQSESKGVDAMRTLIEQYVASCPNSKYALLGYSQGAQVIGDLLCGTSEPGWLVTSSLSSDYSSNFVASIQMGDPSFVPNQPQDAGTSTVAGIFNRTNPSGCEPYESRMKSYCNMGDFFCAKGIGPDAIAIHLLYITEYGANASNFVASQFSNPASTSTTSSTGTATLMTSTTTSTSTSGTGNPSASPTNNAAGIQYASPQKLVLPVAVGVMMYGMM